MRHYHRPLTALRWYNLYIGQTVWEVCLGSVLMGAHRITQLPCAYNQMPGRYNREDTNKGRWYASMRYDDGSFMNEQWYSCDDYNLDDDNAYNDNYLFADKADAMIFISDCKRGYLKLDRQPKPKKRKRHKKNIHIQISVTVTVK